MDRCDGRLEVLERQFELLGIALLGLVAEGGLSERGHKLFQALDAVVLALVSHLCGDQHRLQSGNIVRKIGGIQHGCDLPDRPYGCPRKRTPESSCRSHSTASGARASMARTRRQSRPENSASNWAWFSVISPSRIAGQVKLCSSSRL